MRPTTLRTLLPLLALAALTAAFPAVAAAAADPFTAAATPGEHHRTLASLAGTYDLESTFWPAPGAPPEVSKLPALRELILGGRALRLEVGPDAEGFRGMGLMGYDNVAKTFWYTWTDTTTTGVSNLTGTLDERGSGTLEGSTPTPFGATNLRVEIRTQDGDEIHDYFVAGDNGQDFKMLELRYRPTAR